MVDTKGIKVQNYVYIAIINTSLIMYGRAGHTDLLCFAAGVELHGEQWHPAPWPIRQFRGHAQDLHEPATARWPNEGGAAVEVKAAIGAIETRTWYRGQYMRIEDIVDMERVEVRLGDADHYLFTQCVKLRMPNHMYHALQRHLALGIETADQLTIREDSFWVEHARRPDVGGRWSQVDNTRIPYRGPFFDVGTTRVFRVYFVEGRNDIRPPPPAANPEPRRPAPAGVQAANPVGIPRTEAEAVLLAAPYIANALQPEQRRNMEVILWASDHNTTPYAGLPSGAPNPQVIDQQTGRLGGRQLSNGQRNELRAWIEDVVDDDGLDYREPENRRDGRNVRRRR